MDVVQLVVFRLGDCEYAVAIDQVQEILNVVDITRVPRAPYYILGVFNLRGKIQPAIDLQLRLGLGRTEIQDGSRLVVVKVQEHVVGLLVDAVLETTQVERADIEPAAVMMGSVAQELVQGIVKIGDRLLTWLDLSSAVAKEGDDAAERQVG